MKCEDWLGCRSALGGRPRIWRPLLRRQRAALPPGVARRGGLRTRERASWRRHRSPGKRPYCVFVAMMEVWIVVMAGAGAPHADASAYAAPAPSLGGRDHDAGRGRACVRARSPRAYGHRSWRSVRCSHRPSAISAPATMELNRDSARLSSTIAMTAPRKGASEKRRPSGPCRDDAARAQTIRDDPTPKNPTTNAAPSRRMTASARREAAPELGSRRRPTRPLISAMTTGSADESLRVRLLSMPHARQAAAISKPPSSRRSPRPCQDNTNAPARIEAAPSRRPTIDVLPKHDPGDRHGRQSFEIQQQRTRGGRSSREPEHQQQRPMTPPKAMIAISHGRSARRSGASEALTPSTERPTWPIASPRPAPR